MGIDFIILYIIIFIFGAVFGSFACCQAWRIHESKSGKSLGSRSVCMHCNEKLKWYDNIPVISWLMLRGKCRFCKEKIGVAEILSEISLGLAFVGVVAKYASAFPTVSEFLSADFITIILHMAIFLVALIPFWITLIYDAKWGELPVFVMITEIIIALIFQLTAPKPDWFQVFISSGMLAGLYYLLYFFSKEKLVGGGDWILCVSIGIFLGRWEFIVLELFFSNLAASIAGVPQIVKKDKKPIPFGPFLILAMLLILLIEGYITKFLVI